ncbi:iron chaperone [Pediococcus siamensis]|uniref:iron chaperone n=1 Tax=Pediococcus siamensis TaxID=381829 RepID=UPI0039A3D13A
MKKYNDIADYMADLPKMQRAVAQIMRELLADAAPEAQETFSYNMPALKQNGKVLVYFAATQKHLGFYPTPAQIEAFAEQLKDFHTSKGTIQIPYDRPLPVKLIRQIVAFRIAEVKGK